MSFLLIYGNGFKALDLPLLNTFFSNTRGIVNVSNSSSDQTLLEGEFHFENEEIWFRLRRDLTCLSMDDRGIGSATLCLLLQEVYPEALKVVDEGYNFELPLSTFKTPEELNRAMLDALG